MNKKIRFEFIEFKMEIGKDLLMIYDISCYDSLIIVFDGIIYKLLLFILFGNVLWVWFISDGVINRKGFSFNYK